MRPITFTAETSTGRLVTLEGYPTTTPGLLVITRHGGTCGDPTCWQLVHARSGMVLKHCWDSPEGALAGAQVLASFTDWQQTWEHVRPVVRAEGPRLKDAMERIGIRDCARKTTRCRRNRSKPYVDNGVIA